jgi:Tol biopolymer transport system component
VATGRTLKLSECDGVRVSQPQFSGDSGLLVLGKEHRDTNFARIFQVDLHRRLLETVELTDGFLGPAAATGAFTFYRGTAHPVELLLRTPGGKTHSLQPPGPIWSAAWSPDGNWLAYHSYGPQPHIVLAEARTGRTRIVDRIYTPQGHGGPAANWSPDSRHFVYRAVEEADARGWVSKLAVPEGDKPSRAIEISWWLDANRYIEVQERREDGRAVRDIYEVDLRTGARRQIESAVSGSMHRSPDGTKFALTTGQPGSSTSPRTQVFTSGGQPLYEVHGALRNWSFDSRYFLAVAGDGDDCPRNAILIYRGADGHRVRCMDKARLESYIARFSPARAELAYAVSRPVDPDTRIGRPPLMPLTSDVYLLNLETGAERKLLADARGGLYCLVWSPDGRWLILTDRRGYEVGLGCD